MSIREKELIEKGYNLIGENDKGLRLYRRVESQYENSYAVCKIEGVTSDLGGNLENELAEILFTPKSDEV